MSSPRDRSSDAVAIADIWHEAPPSNAFMQRLGPLKRRRSGEGWAYGLLAEEGHGNGSGVVHGGALAAFIDEVVGTVAHDVVGRRHVTVQLETRFLAPVAVGDFVEARYEIVKTTGSMTFIEAKLFVADAVVATASAILKAVRPKG